MLWLILSLLAAFFESIKVVLSKKSMNEETNEYVVAWSMRFFTLLFLFPLLLFIEIPVIGNRFWEALFISGLINTITSVLYMKALKLSDISLSHPMTTFSPFFILLTAPFILGEFPTIYGLIGVLLIVLGAYSMNISKFKEGFFTPFKALVTEKGPRYMLAVAFLWSIAGTYDKVGLLNSSPIFWAISIHLFLTTVLFPIMLIKSKNRSTKKIESNIFDNFFIAKKQITSNIRVLALIGLSVALLHICQTIALSLTLVVYVSAIKKLSVLMSIIFGYLFFKEKNIKERLFGATIMVIGVVIIALT
ncbi:MAG: EamA family transporter [Candidatus Aenigmarchaeota archaeon]|nr:EamA family transporter [Candidatus Aenigmarchaeota archaeon]